MENWMKISLLLCIYGFFRELRASEPFLTDFLSGKWRNLTSEQVNKDVYPWATYSYLSQLIIAFLFTDMLRYKPLIILSAFVGCIISCLMLWTYTLGALQIAEILYGTFMATEVAYYTYIYAKVERNKYQQVTGYTRSAILAGRFLAGVIAQVFVSMAWMDLRELNYITLGSQVISVFWAFALPAVGTSLYFYNRQTESSLNGVTTGSSNNLKSDLFVNGEIKSTDDRPKFSTKRAALLLWTHFKESYSNGIVVQWSLWWALAACGFSQVQLYIQFLWQQTNPDHENVYNGAVEAALTLLGALGAFSAGYLDSKRYERWDMWLLTICSGLQGSALIWAAFTSSVWISYVMYIIFGILYHFMITVASVNVAKRLQDDSFGLIFGINTLLSLVFQSLLTVIVISENGFELDPRNQFVVYGGYFVVLALIYGIKSASQDLFMIITKNNNNKSTS